MKRKLNGQSFHPLCLYRKASFAGTPAYFTRQSICRLCFGISDRYRRGNHRDPANRRIRSVDAPRTVGFETEMEPRWQVSLLCRAEYCRAAYTGDHGSGIPNHGCRGANHRPWLWLVFVDGHQSGWFGADHYLSPSQQFTWRRSQCVDCSLAKLGAVAAEKLTPMP